MISAKNACMIMYNCGFKNIHEPEIFKRCEMSLIDHENRLEPRLVFGGLYGALKTNAASSKLMNFLIEEFKKINIKKEIPDAQKKEEKPQDNDENDLEAEIEEDKNEIEIEKPKIKVPKPPICIIMCFNKRYLLF